MRTSCRCSGAVGWLVKEPGSRMPLVTSSSAVTDFSFSLLGRLTVCLPYIMQGERTPLNWKKERSSLTKVVYLLIYKEFLTQRSELGHSRRLPSQVIRRGQDSNLQSSGHEPDESTNSSTPLLPLLFLSLFPPRSPALVAWPGLVSGGASPLYRLEL